jgi:hypothetical protein
MFRTKKIVIDLNCTLVHPLGQEVARQKQRALDASYRRNPERFVRGQPRIPMPPKTVAINPVVLNDDGSNDSDRVNFPTLSAAGYVKKSLSLK